MQRLWVTGYRDYELGIFDPKSPQVAVIKRTLTQHLIDWLNQSEEEAWLLSGPQPGAERWALETGLDLQADYPQLKLALMLPFQNLAANWKEERQAALSAIQEQVDYVGTLSNQPYQGPQQLQAYQRFMVDHTEESLLLYDPERTSENEGVKPPKVSYDYRFVQRWAQQIDYATQLITFDELQEVANEMAEEERERQAGWQ